MAQVSNWHTTGKYARVKDGFGIAAYPALGGNATIVIDKLEKGTMKFQRIRMTESESIEIMNQLARIFGYEQPKKKGE